MDGRVPPYWGPSGQIQPVQAWLDALDSGEDAIWWMLRGASEVQQRKSVNLFPEIFNVLAEVAAEHVRRLAFPQLAPRLESVHAFPSLERAQQFAREKRAQYRRLFYYEVRLDPTAKIFDARITAVDFQLASTLQGSWAHPEQYYRDEMNRAHAYWASASSRPADPEYLLYGPVIAMREVKREG